LSGRDQGPSGGVSELHVERSRIQPKVRIPDAAGADIQQSTARVRQHVSGIPEAEFQYLVAGEFGRKDDRNEVVSSSFKLCSFQRGILDEINRVAIGLD